MKKLLIFVFLIISANLFSQDGVLDVIYFKNGNILKGMITELIPGKSIKITDVNGKDYVYNLDLIEKIEKQNFDKTDFMNKTKYDTAYYADQKFSNLTKIGVVRNISDYKNNITVSNIISFQTSTFSIGIGGSYIKYATGYTVPVFLDAKYTFKQIKVKPYFYLDLGHSVSDEKGKGIYFQTGAGVKFPISKIFSIVFDAAYSYQKVKYTLSGYNVVEYRDNLHITTGVQF